MGKFHIFQRNASACGHAQTVPSIKRVGGLQNSASAAGINSVVLASKYARHRFPSQR
jgi:hypothetical protein